MLLRGFLAARPIYYVFTTRFTAFYSVFGQIRRSKIKYLTSTQREFEGETGRSLDLPPSPPSVQDYRIPDPGRGIG